MDKRQDLHYEDFPPTWIDSPDLLGRATLGVTIFLGVCSLIVVGLRVYARQNQNGCLAWDDYSMIVATAFYTTSCVFAGMGIYAGIGSLDDKQRSAWNMIAGAKWLTFWQIMYAWSLPFIKFSIGLTILRITTDTVYRILIWIIVGLSSMSCLIGFFAVIFVCMPMEKSWMGALVEGSCADGAIITKISYLISALAVVTDWGCAIIPTIIVWGLQMKTKMKISISVILAIGAIASAATIVRLPFLSLYNATENYLHGLAHIMLWSNIECGIGIIAGSLPSLKALLNFWLGRTTDRDNSYGHQGASSGLQTIGGSGAPRRGATGHKSANQTTCEADTVNGEWIQLQDSESQKHIITTTHDITVQYEPKSGSRSDSTEPVNRF